MENATDQCDKNLKYVETFPDHDQENIHLCLHRKRNLFQLNLTMCLDTFLSLISSIQICDHLYLLIICHQLFFEYVLKAEQVKDALILHKKINLTLNVYKEQLLNEYLRARGAHPMAAALANGSQAATLAIFF